MAYNSNSEPEINPRKITSLLVIDAGLIMLDGAFSIGVGSGCLFFILLGLIFCANAYVIFKGKLQD